MLGGEEAVLLGLEMFWILNEETVRELQFPNISLDTLHLYIKSFPTKNSKGQILTLISNNFLCFNCLSYEIVQHKLNQELTNINTTLKKIFTILELKEHGKWFY